MAKQQKYGIRFPINVSSEDKTLFDLNYSRAEKIKSEIMHVVFTPKGQRIRKPDFGTRLIQFIFNPQNDSWNDVVSEIKEAVRTWVPDCEVKEVEVKEVDNGLTLACRIRYTLNELDGTTRTYEIISKL